MRVCCHASVSGGDWVFSGGRRVGRRVEVARTRLADLAIVLRPAPQAARLQLAAELPAPVLSDLLGLAGNTGAEVVRIAESDWSAKADAGPSK